MKIVVLLAGMFSGAAMADAPQGDWHVRAHYQVVRMPQARALDLVPRLLDAKTAAAAFRDIQAGLANEAFAPVADMSCSGHAGEDLVAVREVTELPYPVQYRQEEPRLGPVRSVVAASKERLATNYPATDFEPVDCGAILLLTPEILPAETGFA